MRASKPQGSPQAISEPEDLMAATLEQIGRANAALNAIVSMRDAGALLAEARAVDLDGPRGPLSGIPIAIKDLADVTGMPTSQGSPLFAGHTAQSDDPHVARLRAAGAIFIGKTNTPEFGLGSHTYNPVHGMTRNPYALDRSCGGSSGGAAVALAADMLSVADGSDMMGSLRNPAGWNNVYGHRPTWGRVPGAGAGDLYLHQLSTRGPMARAPADLALMLDVMSAPDPLQPQMHRFAHCGSLSPEAAGKRIAWLSDWGGAWAMEDGILSLCETALEVLSAAGAEVDAVGAPFDREALWKSWTSLRSWTISAELAALHDDPATGDQIKPAAIWEIEQGRRLSALDVHCASGIRSDWFRAAASLFEHYDALALPTAQVWPFPADIDWPKEIAGQNMDTYHRWMEVTVPASLIGLPTVAMPAGFGPDGLPMGLQLIGRPGDDAGLLRIAEAYHQATRWPQTHPPELS